MAFADGSALIAMVEKETCLNDRVNQFFKVLVLRWEEKGSICLL